MCSTTIVWGQEFINKGKNKREGETVSRIVIETVASIIQTLHMQNEGSQKSLVHHTEHNITDLTTFILISRKWSMSALPGAS